MESLLHALLTLVNFALHIDLYLQSLAAQYGTWIYGILFAIVFCETGLVVTPILPGDSLLFAAGALAGTGSLHLGTVAAVLGVAASAGDSTNYWIGYYCGPRVFSSTSHRLLNRRHLEETQQFYARHGRTTIIVARFVPIIRTFAPFVAGIGRMHYLRFVSVSLLATLAWIATFVGGGYCFGNIPSVREHFTLVVFAIIGISIVPALLHWWKARR